LGENPIGPCKLTSIDLSRNALGKTGAKELSAALEVNASLVNLDLSGCKIGVSGMYSICDALLKNTTIQSINLYRNIIDVDGARRLGQVLAANKTIEHLDIGHNRIRQTGLKAIVDGIVSNSASKLSTLAIRSNFINDDSFTNLFEQLVWKGSKHQLRRVFLKMNFLSEFHKCALAKRTREEGVKVYVDDFEKVSNIGKERLDHSIWISPLNASYINEDHSIANSFMETLTCGLVKDVRIRTGKAVPGRPSANIYAVVEFYHENSIPRCLKAASKRLVSFGGVRNRIYKAGTRTAIILPSQKRR